MLKALAISALATTVFLVCADTATAKPAPRAVMAEGGYVLPPVAFTKFCIDYPGECAGGAARVHLNAARMAALAEVNRRVNAAIAPTPDRSRFRFWALNVTRGDCNNYAIQKRHELIRSGWPAGALSLSVVKTSWGEGHLVVTVRTDAGDYVLDNLRARVVDWRSAGYRWVMRQSARNPQYWVAVNSDRLAAALAEADNDEPVASDSEAETRAAPAAKRQIAGSIEISPQTGVGATPPG